jgi:hypothetical protein
LVAPLALAAARARLIAAVAASVFGSGAAFDAVAFDAVAFAAVAFVGSDLGGCSGRSAGDGVSVDIEHLTGVHADLAPGKHRGHIGVDRRGEQYLFGSGDPFGQPFPPRGVEFSEDVVE